MAKSTKERRSGITNEEIVTVYKNNGCSISSTCDAIGINRLTLKRWRDADPELERMILEADESVIDFVESKLIEQIRNDNVTAIIFFLKTKAKRRGYIESSEVVANVNGLELRPLTNAELDELKELNK